MVMNSPLSLLIFYFCCPPMSTFGNSQKCSFSWFGCDFCSFLGFGWYGMCPITCLASNGQFWVYKINYSCGCHLWFFFFCKLFIEILMVMNSYFPSHFLFLFSPYEHFWKFIKVFIFMVLMWFLLILGFGQYGWCGTTV